MPITDNTFAIARAKLIPIYSKGNFQCFCNIVGGVVSPLLANIALHGLETHLNNCLPKTQRPGIIRYADDFVILHHNLEILKMLQRETESWLAEIGLRLKPAKTCITHTLNPYEGHTGFDFLGFEVRQYQVGKYHTRTYRGKSGFKTLIKPGKKAQQHHLRQIKQIIRQHRGSNQAALIASLNPVIRGWSAYFSTVISKRIFDRMDKEMIRMLLQWAKWRHRNKSAQWWYHNYWQKEDGRILFNDGKNKGILKSLPPKALWMEIGFIGQPESAKTPTSP